MVGIKEKNLVNSSSKCSKKSIRSYAASTEKPNHQQILIRDNKIVIREKSYGSKRSAIKRFVTDKEIAEISGRSNNNNSRTKRGNNDVVAFNN